MKIRGLMLDMARVTERFDHYMEMARNCSGWGYNTIFAHVTDNEGCAVVFNRRPELATAYALDRDKINLWIEEARSHEISIIPEIECFGHTRFIHDLPRYKHLAMPCSGHFNAINPLHPDTHAILNDLIHDAAEMFDSPYIHAGFDEVNLGDTTILGDAAKDKETWEIYAEMVVAVHQMITRYGKRMIIWGDHLVSEPRIAERIPKDIIVADWQYHADMTDKSIAALIGMGFQVIASPSSSRSGDMLMPRANTQDNLQRFSKIAHGAGDGVVGLMNTVWCPGRMLCGAELFALALGGAWFNDPDTDPLIVTEAFVTERYGISNNSEPIAAAILELSSIIPDNSLLRQIMQTQTSNKASNAPIAPAQGREMATIAESAMRLREAFVNHQHHVTEHRYEYDNYILVCDFIDWVSQLGEYRLTMNESDQRASLAEQGAGLLLRCRTDWETRRYHDDPKKDQDPYGEQDGLISNLAVAVSQLNHSSSATQDAKPAYRGALR